jgi:hypothetical protein
MLVKTPNRVEVRRGTQLRSLDSSPVLGIYLDSRVGETGAENEAITTEEIKITNMQKMRVLFATTVLKIPTDTSRREV